MNLREYHAHPAWSPTALKAAVTGTMQAWWHRFGPGAQPFEATPDMVKGDLVDALLTPPFALEQRFALYPTVARNTKAGAANCAAGQSRRPHPRQRRDGGAGPGGGRLPAP
jgi:hypothetical protein